MTFEEKIAKNAKIRERNLSRPAKLAADKPDTGVKILKKGAYYLIQDCAKVLTVSVIFYFLYNMTYQGSKTLRLSEKLFTDIISFLILGLASYHLILRKLINI